jgi:hypothetical protein
MTEWWLIATANIDLDRHTSATLRSDGGASYVFDLGASKRESVFLVWSTFGLFMQPDTSVQVTGTIGAVAADFATASPPTKDQVDLWTHLLDASDKLPADLPATLLSLHFLDRIVVDVSLLAPDDTTKETFTVEAYGDRLWPVIRPQLAAMAALPDAWSYFASWHPSYAELQHNIFISLLSDQAPTDNGDESTWWSQAAREYVDGLS